MKKTYIYIALLISSIVFLFSSCNRIPEEQRLIEVDHVATDGKRTVLLEDFTGELCVNCPKAALEIHKLKELYKDKVVAVGLHGSDAFTPKGSPLRCDDAVAYYLRFANGAGLPAGMIDRKKFPDNAGVVIDGYATWAGFIKQELELPQLYQIEGSAKIDENEEQLQVTVKVTAVDGGEHPEKAMLQLWLIEDGIIYNQVGVENKTSYEHNHVLRGAINGTWGEALEVGKTYSYNYQLPKIENSGNCSLVAFVYDAKNMEVLEAFQTKVK